MNKVEFNLQKAMKGMLKVNLTQNLNKEIDQFHKDKILAEEAFNKREALKEQ